MDKLEKFIKDNQAEFDQSKVDLDWSKVEDGLNKTESPSNDGTIRVKKWWLYTGIAASIAILIGAFVISNSNTEGGNTSSQDEVAVEKQQELDQKEPSEVSLADISEDYAEIEEYYVVQVNSKVAELKSLNPDPEFLEDINSLEEDYELLKKELGAGGDDEIIIEAMIENYRLKLEVLEEILNDLKSTNNTDYGVEI